MSQNSSFTIGLIEIQDVKQKIAWSAKAKQWADSLGGGETVAALRHEYILVLGTSA